MASLNFKGKTAVWNHHLSVPYHTLDKDKKSSLAGVGESENMIIEGDNLLALKALLPKYQGKVKCIYIDPPYNTGNEGWVYNDNVSSPVIQDWLGQTVGKEGEDLTRHDKWLCMMTPRLKLLRELLAEDGVIFVSIDDNEVHYLRHLLDEVFGEENYLNTFCWVSNLKGRQISGSGAAKTYEYVLTYAKRLENVGIFEMSIEELKALMPSTYKGFNYEAENDDGGDFVVKNELYNTNSIFNETTRPSLVFNIHYNFDTHEVKFSGTNEELEFDNFVKIIPKRNNDGKHLFHAWRWSKDKIKRELDDLKFVKTEKSAKIYTKIRAFANTTLKDLITDVTTTSGSVDVKNLFGDAKSFDYPKPVDLIKIFLRQVEDDAIVLDSFAGSGTTAQAVLELNKEDGGNRKYILVQIPEAIAEGKPAYEAGYRYVHEITRDRVKKVIARDKLDVGFTYYTLGPSINARDILKGKDLPSWESFAKYVHYLATGKPIEEVKKPNATWEIVSGTKHTRVYCLYKDTLEGLKTLALTRDWLDLVQDTEGKKIVYAPACFIDKDELDARGISFVQIPFALFQRK